MTHLPRLDLEACLSAVSAAHAAGAARGYQHPLGFSHIAIPMPGGRKLRLHVWDSDLAPEDADLPQIHNHAFRFVSLVLRGAIRHTPFVVRPVEGPVRAADYQVRRVEQRGDDTVLVDTGQHVAARPRDAQVIGSGHLYAYPENAYHISENVGGTVAMTLVVAEQISGVTSCVLTPHETGVVGWRKTWLADATISAFLAEARVRLAALHALSGMLE